MMYCTRCQQSHPIPEHIHGRVLPLKLRFAVVNAGYIRTAHETRNAATRSIEYLRRDALGTELQPTSAYVIWDRACCWLAAQTVTGVAHSTT